MPMKWKALLMTRGKIDLSAGN